MSQVQNTLLHKYVQPITVLAIAYLAGSKRFIQYFPEASRGGLCLAAGLGAIGTLASPKLLRTKKDEHHVYSFTRVAACLSLGTLMAYASTKSLTGRLTLSFPAASHFIGVEVVAAGTFAGMSLLLSKPRPQKNDTPPTTSTGRDKHPTHTKDGKPLGKENSPPSSTKKINPQDEKEKPREPEVRPLSALNKKELEKYTEENPSLPLEKQFALNQARQAQGLEVVWPAGITQKHLQYASDQDQVVLLHLFYKKHPLALEVCEKSLRDSLTQLFSADATLSAFPPVHETLIGLSLEQIDALTKEEAQFAFDQMDSKKTSTSFHKLVSSKQVAYKVTMKKYGMNDFWINPITLAHVDALPTIPQGVEWMHEEFLEYPLEFAQLDTETKEPLLKLFVDLTPIPSPQDLLKDLDDEKIQTLDEDTVCEWHQYFTGELGLWSTLTPDMQTAFLSCFETHKIDVDRDLLPKGASHQGNCTIS